jgi:N-acetylmuramoyl-L-alanine amidase
MRTIKLPVGVFLLFCALFCVGSGHCTRLVSLDKISGNNRLRMFSPNSFGTKGAVFSFNENSKTFKFNNILMPLSFRSVLRNGKIYIDQADCKCHVSPLLPTARRNYRAIKRIAIDAGHGGEDSGAISKSIKLKEKILTMDVCLRLEKLLKQRGYEVILTRASDCKIPLNERSYIANNAGADLFISVHFNSEQHDNATGIETFVLTPTAHPSTYQKAGEVLSEKFSGNKFDDLNTVLGYCLQSSFIKTTMAADRGVKHSRFTVLRQLHCPGALVECGFLSNATDSKKIASASHRNRLAESIVEGIIKFEKALSQ